MFSKTAYTNKRTKRILTSVTLFKTLFASIDNVFYFTVQYVYTYQAFYIDLA